MMAPTLVLHYKAGIWECSHPFFSRHDLEAYLREWATCPDLDDWDTRVNDNPPMFRLEQVTEMYVTTASEAAA